MEEASTSLSLSVESQDDGTLKLALSPAFALLHSEIFAFMKELYASLLLLLTQEDPDFGISDRVSLTQELREVTCPSVSALCSRHRCVWVCNCRS